MTPIMLLTLHEYHQSMGHDLLVLGETVQTAEFGWIGMNGSTALGSWSLLFLAAAADDLRTSHCISAFCLDRP